MKLPLICSSVGAVFLVACSTSSPAGSADASAAALDGTNVGSDAATDAGVDATTDASIGEDAMTTPDDASFSEDSGSCAASFTIGPEAGAGSCAVLASDVECDADTQCKVYAPAGCYCIVPAYGVSTTPSACVAPPCPPGNCTGATGFLTETCQVVPSQSTIVASCVQGRCITQAN